jgi:hypothetical protein
VTTRVGREHDVALVGEELPRERVDRGVRVAEPVEHDDRREAAGRRGPGRLVERRGERRAARARDRQVLDGERRAVRSAGERRCGGEHDCDGDEARAHRARG